MNNFLTAFKFISGIIASIGVIIPAYSYWQEIYYPPLFKLAGIFSAIGAFAVLVIYYWKPVTRIDDTGLPPLIQKAIAAIVLSVILLIGYFVLFNISTVAGPGKVQYQIGFGKSDWSLTNEGKQVKAAHPNKTVQDWMTDDSLFRDGGPDVIWTTWSIVLSGVSMVIFYLLAFVLWALGWALVAKQSALSEDDSPPA